MDNILTGVSVPAIAAIVYWIVNLIKYTTGYNEKVLRFVPLISAGLGIVCGVIAFFAAPQLLPTDNIVVAIVISAASGLTATGCHQIIKQLSENKEAEK